MAADLDQLVEQLSGLSVIEAASLSKKLEEKWGVSAAAPVAPATKAAPAGLRPLTPVLAGTNPLNTAFWWSTTEVPTRPPPF